MENVVLVIHLFLALALTGVILLQPSADSGGLTSSSSSFSGFMTPRGSANLLTRTTIILALGFMATSLTLVVLSGSHKKDNLIDQLEQSQATTAPADTAKTGGAKDAVTPAKAGAEPVKPTAPAVPTGK